MTRLSGWCSPAFGTCESERAHGICEQRRRDAGVVCDCANFGGHESAQNPTVDRDSTSEAGKMGAHDKTAPGGALTPESQGLADYKGVD